MRKGYVRFKAIETKYIPATTFMGSRIKATDHDGNSVVLPYDNALNADEIHYNAAKALCDKMKWKGEIVGGSLKIQQFGYLSTTCNHDAQTYYTLEGPSKSLVFPSLEAAVRFVDTHGLRLPGLRLVRIDAQVILEIDRNRTEKPQEDEK